MSRMNIFIRAVVLILFIYKSAVHAVFQIFPKQKEVIWELKD